MQLVRNIDEYIDPRINIDEFYEFVWNVDTALGFGLDIWGRIVGVGRYLRLVNVDYFGFEEALPDSHAFNESPFYDGLGVLTDVYRLENDAYRLLILTKALANVISTNSPAINQLLQNLFGHRGKAYVLDLGGMAMQYTFEFELTPVEYAIVTQSGALPVPAGVTVTYVEIP